MTFYPPLWLWLLAIVLTFLGIWLSPAFDRLLVRLPLWFLWLLVLVLVAAEWWFFYTLFSGLAFRFSFPLCVFPVC
jgi:hypothetical protein